MSKIFHPLLLMLAGCTEKELARQVQYLKEENQILRAKLPKRIMVTPEKRRSCGIITIERKVHFGQGENTYKELREGKNTGLVGGRVPRVSRLMALAIRFEQMIRDGNVADQGIGTVGIRQLSKAYADYESALFGAGHSGTDSFFCLYRNKVT